MYQSYQELDIWKKAMELAGIVYKLANKLPKEELFGLASQMKRAAVSIPSNIAEGKARATDRDFCHFLSISQGSRAELETQLLLCEQVGFLSSEEIEYALNLARDIGAMTRRLIYYLRTPRT